MIQLFNYLHHLTQFLFNLCLLPCICKANKCLIVTVDAVIIHLQEICRTVIRDFTFEISNLKFGFVPHESYLQEKTTLQLRKYHRCITADRRVPQISSLNLFQCFHETGSQ